MAWPKGKRGAAHPKWKGGRTLTSHGYVLVNVGKDHPLADCRGYAYEHRLKAGALRGELVHHKDEDKKRNVRRNLKRCRTIAEHRFLHRKPGCKLRKPGEHNPIISCKCGCGTRFLRFDSTGRPRGYISGHNLHKEK